MALLIDGLRMEGFSKNIIITFVCDKPLENIAPFAMSRIFSASVSLNIFGGTSSWKQAFYPGDDEPFDR